MNFGGKMKLEFFLLGSWSRTGSAWRISGSRFLRISVMDPHHWLDGVAELTGKELKMWLCLKWVNCVTSMLMHMPWTIKKEEGEIGFQRGEGQFYIKKTRYVQIFMFSRRWWRWQRCWASISRSTLRCWGARVAGASIRGRPPARRGAGLATPSQPGNWGRPVLYQA